MSALTRDASERAQLEAKRATLEYSAEQARLMSLDDGPGANYPRLVQLAEDAADALTEFDASEEGRRLIELTNLARLQRREVAP